MGWFKKKKKEKYSGATNNDINIVILRLMNNMPVEVAEFNALQIRDPNNNLFLSNVDKNFKVDLERKRHYIIDHLYYKLELSDESKESKVEKINIKITEIETKIKDLEKKNDGTENITNFKNDLRHFKILKYTVENSGDGSFEILNSKGQREMRFLARDGVYDPYFYRSDKEKGSPLNMYPDIALSRKYYKETDEKIENRLLRNQNPSIFEGLKGFMIIVAVVVLMGSGVLLNMRAVENFAEADARIAEWRDKAEGTAIQCSYYYAILMEEGLINRSIEYKTEQAPDKPDTSAIVDISQNILGNNQKAKT